MAGFRTRWLARHCPVIWGLLNVRARRCLPPGLAVYLSSPGALAGRANLRAADVLLQQLVCRIGERRVAEAYARDLSGIGSEDQLRDLLCEISLISELAAVANEVVLRPAVAAKRADARARVSRREIWAEVKRYEDRWFMRDSARPGRALAVKGYREAGGATQAPHSLELRQKLDGMGRHGGVPEQLPRDGMGVLFLFHSGSFGRDADWIAAALFGDAYGLGALSEAKYGLGHESNGLFLLERWQRVSACCWVRDSQETGRTRILRTWHNPLATCPLPAEVLVALEAMGR